MTDYACPCRFCGSYYVACQIHVDHFGRPLACCPDCDRLGPAEAHEPPKKSQP